MSVDTQISTTSATAQREPDVLWREIAAGLWVGRSEGRHAGIIERGRRYTFTDCEGTVHPGFETLAAAQDAATEPIPVIASTDGGPDVEPRPALLLAVVTGLVGTGTLVLCVFGLTLVP